MKIKDVSNKANKLLADAEEVAKRKGLVKWLIVAAGALLVVLIVAFLLWPSKARATGYEHMIVKKIVVVKTVSAPAVVAAPVAAPAAAAPAAAAPAATSAAAPAQQPSGGGGGSSWLASGGIAFIGSGIFLVLAGVSHFLFCAEDDKKKKEDRVCYRPLRDGMP